MAIPIIQVKNLYKIYKVGDTKVYALHGVDFEIYKGEFCAIVGPSGSGKSTLLNMLAGLEKPSKGEIVIDKVHIEHMTENQLVEFRRKRVGFIFQSYNLLKTLNAVENVALPLSFRGVPKKKAECDCREVSKTSRIGKADEAHGKRHVRRSAAEGRYCQGFGGKSQNYFCRRAYWESGLQNHDGDFKIDAPNCKGTAADLNHGNP